jgi:hypothetical protein
MEPDLELKLKILNGKGRIHIPAFKLTKGMARIFNIYFTYDSASYNAIVSVRTTPFFTEYTLLNFNEELKILLPGNKIISSTPEQFIFQNATSDHSITLMKEIIRAVREHLLTMKA